MDTRRLKGLILFSFIACLSLAQNLVTNIDQVCGGIFRYTMENKESQSIREQIPLFREREYHSASVGKRDSLIRKP
jgi:hypothetical protein